MMILLFMELSAVACGQGYDFVNEKECFDFIAKIDSAKKNKYKIINEIDYKSSKGGKGELTSTENYTVIGNIKTRIEYYSHHKVKSKTDFYYDENNRLCKMLKQFEGTDNYHFITKVGYNEIGQVAYMLSKFTNLEYPSFDTVQFNYNPNGTLGSRFMSPLADSTFYHYDDKGDLIKGSSLKDDTIDNRILDKNGCVVQHKIDTSFREIMERDSLCNLLSFTQEQYEHGKWIIDHKMSYKYVGKTIVEATLYTPRYPIIGNNFKLAWHDDTRFEYNANGSLDKEISLSKKGKVIRVRKYVYETY